MNTPATASQAPSRFVTVKEFCARTTLSRGHVYTLISQGLLGKPARITERRVGWPAEVVDNWISERAAGVAAVQ